MCSFASLPTLANVCALFTLVTIVGMKWHSNIALIFPFMITNMVKLFFFHTPLSYGLARSNFFPPLQKSNSGKKHRQSTETWLISMQNKTYTQ